MEILPRSKKSAIIALALVYAIWAIAVPVTKFVAGHIPPFSLLFIRFSISAFILTPIFLIDDFAHPIKIKHLPSFILLAFLGPFASNALFYIGIKSTLASDASVISASFPVVNMLAAAFFLKERSRTAAWIGAMIAFVGTLTIIGEPLLVPGEGLSRNLFGNLIIASSVISWTAFVIVSKKIATDFSSLTLSALYMVFSAIMAIPFAFFEIRGTNLAFVDNLMILDFLSMAFLILGSSVVAYLLLEWSIEKVTAQTAGYLSFIQPAIALTASFILLKEKPSSFFYFGSALVGIGIFLIFRKTQSRVKHHYRS